MNFFERIRLNFYVLLVGAIVLAIAFLSPWNINRMGNDIQQKIEQQLLEGRNR